MRKAVLLSSLAFAIAPAQAAVSDRLSETKARIVALEQNLLTSLRNQKEAKANVRRIQELIALQKSERTLGQARIQEIEKTIATLESRRAVIQERVGVEQRVIRKSLRDLREMSLREAEVPEDLASETINQPRSRLLSNLVRMSLREIETLKIDLEDAHSLEGKIQEERSQLEAMIHEMAEGEEVLELNRKLQLDLIRKTHDERLVQLERYRKLKSDEAQVSHLIKTFNARMELQEVRRQERAAQKSFYASARSAFGQLKGKLHLPVNGEIVGRFGKAFDRHANLTVFKKGIDIRAEKGQAVRSVHQGKIAYSGELSGYGRMVIVDHGDHFYSLCGNLGSSSKKVGDEVKAGEEIGAADTSGSPVYFEIRAHNIPVDPLQWVSL